MPISDIIGVLGLLVAAIGTFYVARTSAQHSADRVTAAREEGRRETKDDLDEERRQKAVLQQRVYTLEDQLRNRRN